METKVEKALAKMEFNSNLPKAKSLNETPLYDSNKVMLIQETGSDILDSLVSDFDKLFKDL